MNDAWNNSYPQSYSVFEAGGCSDHLRCRIQIAVNPIRPRRPFKFTNVIIGSSSFMPTIETFWKETEVLFSSTSAMFRLSKKLKALKPEIRKVNKSYMGNLPMRTKEAYEKLCELQTQMMLNPGPNGIVEETRAFEKWQHLAELEERFLRQKSKLHWLKVGDGNNRYFHQAVKHRETQNLMREVGTRRWLDSRYA